MSKDDEGTDYNSFWLKRGEDDGGLAGIRRMYLRLQLATDGQSDDFKEARNQAYRVTKDVTLCKKLQLCAEALDDLHDYVGEKAKEGTN